MSTEPTDQARTQVLDTDATQPLSSDNHGDLAQPDTEVLNQTPTESQADRSGEHLFEPPSQAAHGDEDHRVWNAQALLGEEPPARGVRMGQLAWGLIVALCGLFLIALAFVPAGSFPLVLIGLVAVLGLTLIVIAVVTSVAHPRRPRAI